MFGWTATPTMGTVGALDAMITWSADGMKQSIQDAITPLRGLVTGVQANPDDGTIKLQGNLGSVTTKPQVTDGRMALQVVDLTGLGLLLPTEIVVGARRVHHPSHRELSARYPCR